MDEFLMDRVKELRLIEERLEWILRFDDAGWKGSRPYHATKDAWQMVADMLAVAEKAHADF